MLAEATEMGIVLPQPGDHLIENPHRVEHIRWNAFHEWYAQGVLPVNIQDVIHALCSNKDLLKFENKYCPRRVSQRLSFLQQRIEELMLAFKTFTRLQKRETVKQKAVQTAASKMLSRLKRKDMNRKDPVKMPAHLQHFPLDIFTDFEMPNEINLMMWDDMNVREQQLELQLALCNANVITGALFDGIQLPEINPVDKISSVDESFVTWWTADGQKARQLYLRHEASEATQDTIVREAAMTAQVIVTVGLSKVLLTTGKSAQEKQDANDDDNDAFATWYFHQSEVRIAFLNAQLQNVEKRQRYTTLTSSGLFPPLSFYEKFPSLMFNRSSTAQIENLEFTKEELVEKELKRKEEAIRELKVQEEIVLEKERVELEMENERRRKERTDMRREEEASKMWNALVRLHIF